MIWIEVVIVGVLVCLLTCTVLNLLVFKRLNPQVGRRPEGEAPFVSVLIPARNEAARIRPCLESLCAQTYPAFEILVLDDNSTDGTADAVAEYGFVADEDANRRVITGAPLPDGWKGKTWACHQLSRAARGEYLLFTDADTVHDPGSICAAMEFAGQSRIDLLSLWPRQIVVSVAEKLVAPLMYVLILTFLPQTLLAVLQSFPRLAKLLPGRMLASLGAANGQFLLFRAESYAAIGGHEGVRDHLVEDIALGRLVSERTGEGMRLVNADGFHLVRCRMYSSAAEVWEGFSKNLRPAFGNAVGAFVMFGVLQFAAFIAPFVLLPVVGPSPGVLAAIALVYAIRGILAVRFRSPSSSWLLHPVGYAFALLIALNSWRLWAAGGLRWKGRAY